MSENDHKIMDWGQYHQWWGQQNQMNINGDCNLSDNCTSYLKLSNDGKSLVLDQNGGGAYVAGSSTFGVKEIEVFHIIAF